MTREIKFKIWDKKNKLLLRTNAVDLRKLEDADFILLQYTGMSDRHKHEIYEQDIVMLEHKYYTVMWEIVRSGWSIKENISGLTIPLIPEKAEISLRMYNANEVSK